MLEWRAVCAERCTYGSGRRSREIAYDYALLLTLLRTYERWLYLAVVLDFASRRIIGWSMKPTLAKETVLDTLLMAVWRRQPEQDVMIHSDQGAKYNIDYWQPFCQTLGLLPSMIAE